MQERMVGHTGCADLGKCCSPPNEVARRPGTEMMWPSGYMGPSRVGRTVGTRRRLSLIDSTQPSASPSGQGHCDAPTAEAARKIVKELRDTTKSGGRVHGKCAAAC
jgi:hypothetical protein